MCVTKRASIRIHWPARSHAWALIGMVIELDGREIGWVRKSEDLTAYVEPGRHILQARRSTAKSEPVELVLAPGENVQLEVRLYTKNFWDLRKTLTMIRTDAAAVLDLQVARQDDPGRTNAFSWTVLPDPDKPQRSQLL